MKHNNKLTKQKDITMQLTNQQTHVPMLNVPSIVGMMKALAPRSFEKTFDGLSTQQIVQAMNICVHGLTEQQIQVGYQMIMNNGYCPDPVMFRKWCLGKNGFDGGFERNFKGKHAALGNILRYINDYSTLITDVEFEAYQRCYEMFNQIQYSGNPQRQTEKAEKAFMEHYDDVVQEFCKQQRLPQVQQFNMAIGKKVEQEEQREVCKGIPDNLLEQLKGIRKFKSHEYLGDVA